MVIVSLNIGLPRREIFGGKELITGICKRPVQGPVLVRRTGFEGDGVGDRKNHGGADKAVCVYSLEHYPFWEKELSTTLPPAAFGENLTVRGLREEDIRIGDVLRAGSALFEVSQPRQPCKTLAARLGRADLPKMMTAAGRTGFYMRVLEEGTVSPGDELRLVREDPLGVTVAFANRIHYHERDNLKGIERVLAVPALSGAWRDTFRKMKEKLLS
jgi:MOSC domain-containing protein YiiM